MSYARIIARILLCCLYLFVHGYCRKVLQYRDDDDTFWSISTPRIPSSSYGTATTGAASRAAGRVGAKIAAVVGGIVAGVAGISFACFRCKKVREKEEEENGHEAVADEVNTTKHDATVQKSLSDGDDDDTYCYDVYDEETSSKGKPCDTKKSLADVSTDNHHPVHLASYTPMVLPSFKVSSTSSSSSSSSPRKEDGIVLV